MPLFERSHAGWTDVTITAQDEKACVQRKLREPERTSSV